MNPLIIGDATIHQGDCLARLREMADQSIQMCVTSPPYFGLRDYGVDGQLGLEPTPDEYVAAMVAVFREVRRVMADDGTLWLNIGDSYATGSKWGGSTSGKASAGLHGAGGGGRGRTYPGLPDKNLIGIPWRLAFALQADGWILRQDIIWHKPNPMPESVTDRCTKAHEYIFLLSKSAQYHYDHEAVKEPAVQAGRVRNDKMGGNKGDDVHHSPGGQFTGSDTRNRRSVWTVATRPYKGAHFATFPPALIEPCILAGSLPGDAVLDPFNGSGTTGQVSLQHGRRYVGIELNQEYVELTRTRLEPVVLALAEAAEPPPQIDLFAA